MDHGAVLRRFRPRHLALGLAGRPPRPAPGSARRARPGGPGDLRCLGQYRLFLPACLSPGPGPRPGDLLGDGAGQPARCAARPGVDELFRHARRGAGLVAGSRPPRRPVAGRPRRAPGGVRHPGGAARLAGGAGRPGLAGNPSAAGGHARARDPGDLPTGPGRPPATNARTAGGGAQCAGVLLLRRRAVHGRRPARPGLRLDRPGHRHCREPRRLAQPTPAAHLEQRSPGTPGPSAGGRRRDSADAVGRRRIRRRPVLGAASPADLHRLRRGDSQPAGSGAARLRRLPGTRRSPVRARLLPADRPRTGRVHPATVRPSLAAGRVLEPAGLVALLLARRLPE